MNTSPSTGGPSKYAWREILGRDLPKRPAEQRITDFSEAHFPFDEETAREQASRCIQCPHPGCVLRCPFGSPIQEWLALTAEGRFLEAAKLSSETSALPEICARLCPKDHLCEDACVVNGPSESVSIGAIEEFLAEYALAHGEMEGPCAPPNGRRVAILGSGPAGLGCADELSRRGYAVTVLDPDPEPGGMLIHGTASFRLGRGIVERRLRMLRDRGVEFCQGIHPGLRPTLAELRSLFDAVFIGLDARKPRVLEAPGVEGPGLVRSTEFIEDAPPDGSEAGWDPWVKGRRVLVVGEDDTAVDCARSAVRRGAAEVICVCPHSQQALPCCRREFEDALEEGVRFEFESAPVGFVRESAGGLRGVRLGKAVLDAEGPGRERGYTVVDGGLREVEADLVVLALGYDFQPLRLEGDLAELHAEGREEVEVDADQMTRVAGVYAGGDVVRGPCQVVDALRDARRAAEGIHARLEARSGTAPVGGDARSG